MSSFEFRGKSILVTGGAGFIGSHLVDKLIELGSRVTVIDNLFYDKKIDVNKAADFYEMDVRNYESLKEHIKNKDVIYHLAAIATTKESSLGWENPVKDYEVNTIGTLNIFRAVVESDTNPKVVYASSAAVYGNPEYTPIDERHPTNPISPYGISKLAGEKYAYAYFREHGIKSVSLRLFNVYGPKQPRYVTYDLLKKIYQNPKELIVLGDGKQIRDYCYVDDAIQAFILAVENDCAGKVFNIGSRKPTSIAELARLLLQKLGKDIRIKYTGKSWKGDIPILIADIRRAREELGFKPTIELEDGLEKTIRWFMIMMKGTGEK